MIGKPEILTIMSHKLRVLPGLCMGVSSLSTCQKKPGTAFVGHRRNAEKKVGFEFGPFSHLLGLIPGGRGSNLTPGGEEKEKEGTERWDFFLKTDLAVKRQFCEMICEGFIEEDLHYCMYIFVYTRYLQWIKENQRDLLLPIGQDWHRIKDAADARFTDSC